MASVDPDRDEQDAVHRALNALPLPRAPRTLLPRVMAAVGAAPRSNARPWFTWPLHWQVASIAAMTLIVAALALVVASPEASLMAGAQLAARVTPHAAATVERAAGLADVARTLWEALIQPVFFYFFVWILVMSAACVAFGAALGRVAFGEIAQ